MELQYSIPPVMSSFTRDKSTQVCKCFVDEISRHWKGESMRRTSS
jgi:hypothetical protein